MYNACYYNVNITGYKAGWIILGLPSIIDFVNAWQCMVMNDPTICATICMSEWITRMKEECPWSLSQFPTAKTWSTIISKRIKHNTILML